MLQLARRARFATRATECTSATAAYQIQSGARTMCTAEPADETAVKKPRARRALLYLPANNEKMWRKAAGLDIDTVCLDLEDAVAVNRKEQAREMATQALENCDFGSSERAVRINPLMTELSAADLTALFKAPVLPDALVVPKVESPEQLSWMFDLCDQLLDDREDFVFDETSEEGAHGVIKILAQVESAKGLLNLREICNTDTEAVTESLTLELDALIMGGDDFAADIGATRTVPADELLYARQATVVHAKAYGLQAIDIVNINFKEPEALEQESAEGARMGFTGKQIIHPAQIDIVQEAFSPSAERIAYAKELVEAFEQNQADGKGAFTFRNQMIDMPTLIQCQTVLAHAKAFGKL